MKGGEGGLNSARLIMSQVQYPCDYIGADGKLYPTVGEAFRKGNILYGLVIRNYYSFTITIKEGKLSSLGDVEIIDNVVYLNNNKNITFGVITGTNITDTSLSLSYYRSSAKNLVGLKINGVENLEPEKKWIYYT